MKKYITFGTVAALMRFELGHGSVDGFAKLLDDHWELSRKVNKDSANTLTDRSIDILIRGRLKPVFQDGPVGDWDCGLE